MRNIIKYIVSLIALVLFLNNSTYSQETEWIKKTSKDGSIEVKYRIYKANNEQGEDAQVIEYEASTTRELPLENCISMMKDVSKHKDFSDDTEESYKINDLSETECLIYYFIDAPWPMPNADCVSKMTSIEEESMAKFEIMGMPDSYEMKDVKRMRVSAASYTFEKIQGNKVKITVYSGFSPVAAAPQWLVKTWFPEGPVDIMNNIIELIEEQS